MNEITKNMLIKEFFAKRDLFFSTVAFPGDERELRKIFIKLLNEICLEKKIAITNEEKSLLIDDLVDDMLGFGKIKALLMDPAVTEIMINGYDEVYVERNGQKELTEVKFTDERQLNRIIERTLRFSSRHVDQLSPFVDASLPDGSRVNIIIPPLAVNGAVITIRKFSQEFQNIEDLVKKGTLNENMAKFLIACIKARLNLMFSGATGSGKTTTLNVLSAEIDERERIITIEDTQELRLRQKHVVRLLTKQPNIEGKGEISIREIFRNTLRMRPDRIIIGEIRSSEAIDMLQAIASGHVGSLAVIHGESPRDVVSRIETVIILSSIALPVFEVRKQIASSLDIIVQQERSVDGVRRITEIAEVVGIKDGEIDIRSLFKFEQKGLDEKGNVVGDWVCSGEKPKFYDIFMKKGVNLPEEIFKKG